ncbi:MAG: plasmid stabilization protein [Deltaproteobacteria bacterium RIFCSPLOWO2_01_FULL_45_74]|nr:MAG: plasmid stabilization protein [Deltaproteobacteria bacterium RIFCSPHIGHO2_01_FULL_43_49]OGQ15351.1 MAG: plasmid stabilization protein [Deltaproteobacteria bacterium RIFCSPHIGHO2_02_FULL_44_53]OGQ31461.1 MAG: plasmid stabilization protein [Deltaproteobacteria bacterium RIFCSPLOWO2_01_FULL_45_74]OGQ42709.1 MAG: plasmid stabilization protein [Deltaproteobacteria bacterium RIFCSPLOWO2_02_FULL_44_34]
MYAVYLEKAAQKDLDKLPKNRFDQIISKIKSLSDNPRPTGCRKITGSQNDWRIRIGDYRVVYEIDDKAKAVRVMRARHRREVYR